MSHIKFIINTTLHNNDLLYLMNHDWQFRKFLKITSFSKTD